MFIVPKVDASYMGKYLVKASNCVDTVECNFELDIFFVILSFVNEVVVIFIVVPEISNKLLAGHVFGRNVGQFDGE